MPHSRRPPTSARSPWQNVQVVSEVGPQCAPETLRLRSVSVQSRSARPPPCASRKTHTVRSSPQTRQPRASLRMSCAQHIVSTATPDLAMARLGVLDAPADAPSLYQPGSADVSLTPASCTLCWRKEGPKAEPGHSQDASSMRMGCSHWHGHLIRGMMHTATWRTSHLWRGGERCRTERPFLERRHAL